MMPLTLASKQYGGTWFGVLMREDRLVASSFANSKRNLEEHLRSKNPRETRLGSTNQSKTALREMILLYQGTPAPDMVELDWQRVSGYQKNVCQVMQRIPKGKVTSYGLIAEKIHSGPRAVGTAVAGNPWPLFVPCHRVIPANLHIGNYSIGGTLSDYGCEVKRDLLEREGVPIEENRIESKALWVPRY